MSSATSTPAPEGPFQQSQKGAVYRLEIISLLAALVCILAGLIAYVLYDLIGLITNLAYFHEWSFHFRSPEHTQLGVWIIITPVLGGIIVGFLAKDGCAELNEP